MNVYKNILFILLVGVNINWCVPTAETDKYEEYIKTAIGNFVKKSQLSKKDTVFSIVVKDFGDIVGINIYGSTRKPVIVSNGSEISLSSLPSRYIEMDGRLFYWHDKEVAPTSEIATVLKKYNFLDTAIINVYIPPYIIDEKKKGEDYYFCKSNLRKFKKVRTNRGLGTYPLPELNCDR